MIENENLHLRAASNSLSRQNSLSRCLLSFKEGKIRAVATDVAEEEYHKRRLLIEESGLALVSSDEEWHN